MKVYYFLLIVRTYVEKTLNRVPWLSTCATTVNEFCLLLY